MDIRISKSPSHIEGEIPDIPGDKSISHRAIMIGALAQGVSRYENFLFGEDCLATLSHFQKMGIDIHADPQKKTVEIHGKGKFGLQAPAEDLDCGNSGTTIRLMTGLMAAQSFSSVLTGDASIQKRPMKRVINPLTQMGAQIRGTEIAGKNDQFPPLYFTPVTQLNAVNYTLPVASAQVKSAILLASLYADGDTSIVEPELCRDHTERMLAWYGADLRRHGATIQCSGAQPLQSPSQDPIAIPSDISSAAFYIVLGLVFGESNILLRGVGLNPTRDRICDVLRQMGGGIQVLSVRDQVEPQGDLAIQSSALTNISLTREDIPILIDEIPILAVAALFAKGTLSVREAKELRFKESDRIAAIGRLVTAMGGVFRDFEDGFEVTPPTTFQPFTFDSGGDHRMAMSALIGATAAGVQATITDCTCIQTSFPNFLEILTRLGVTLERLP